MPKCRLCGKEKPEEMMSVKGSFPVCEECYPKEDESDGDSGFSNITEDNLKDNFHPTNRNDVKPKSFGVDGPGFNGVWGKMGSPEGVLGIRPRKLHELIGTKFKQNGKNYVIALQSKDNPDDFLCVEITPENTICISVAGTKKINTKDIDKNGDIQFEL